MLNPRHSAAGIEKILASSYDWGYPPIASTRHDFSHLRYFTETAEGNANTLFLGDSNMEQYAPRIDYVIKHSARTVNGAIFVGNQINCHLLFEIVTSGSACPDAIQTLHALLEADTTSSLVIVASWRSTHLRGAIEPPQSQRNLIEFLRPFARTKRLFIVLTTPSGTELAPKSMFSGSRTGVLAPKDVSSIEFDLTRFEREYFGVNQALRNVASAVGASVIDPVEFLCPNRHCPVFDELGRPLYLDASHITRSYSISSATYMDRTLQR